MPRPPRPGGGQRCTANTTRGHPCKNYAVRGAKVCAAHGGTAPQVRAAAERRVAEEVAQRRASKSLADVERALAAEGVGPAEVLENAGNRAAAMVVVISELLDELTTVNAFDDEVPSAVAVLYERWLGLAAKISKSQLDAGIDERRTQVAEQDTAVLIAAVRSFMGRVTSWLTDAGVDEGVVVELGRSWGPWLREALEGTEVPVPDRPALEARRVA